MLPWFRPNRKKLRSLTARGETAADENRWEDAANSFRRAVDMAPKLRDADDVEAAALQIQARGRLATAALRLGDTVEALEQQRAILSTAADRPSVAEDAIDTAADLFEVATELHPEPADRNVLVQLLRPLCGGARFENALRALRRSLPADAAGTVIDEVSRQWLETAPDDPQVRLFAASLVRHATDLLEDGDSATAAALAYHTLVAASMSDLGDAITGDLAQLLVDMHRVALEQDDLEALADHRELAAGLREMERDVLELEAPIRARAHEASDRALGSFAAYLRRDPSHRWDRGTFDTAVLEAAEKACRAPRLSPAQIGLTRADATDIERLRRWNEQIAAIAPDLDWPRINEGWLALAEGDLDAAVEKIHAREAPEAVAVALFRLGRWEQALAAAAEADEADPAIRAIRAVCRVFTELPLEPGTAREPDPLVLDEIQEALAVHEDIDWPEVSACRWWVRLLSDEAWSDTGDVDLPGELAEAAFSSDLTPVRALGCRTLAFYDRRQEAVGRLRAAGDRDDIAAREAKLEAGFIDDLLEAGEPAAKPPLPEALNHQWWLLLRAEAQLRGGEGGIEGPVRTLTTLLRSWEQHPAEANGWAGRERLRLRARAHASLARAELAKGDTDEARAHLEHPTVESDLPLWEAAYLRAMAAWQDGDRDAAESLLQEALQHNRAQRRLGCELGVLRADERPLVAKQMLEGEGRSREYAGTMAGALLALERDREALAVLEAFDGPAGPQPARLTWRQGYEARVVQGLQTRSALAERRGDWALAARSLQEVLSFDRDDIEAQARLIWLRRQMPEEHHPDRAKLDELSAMVLSGEPQFYRSRAAGETHPQRVEGDWASLIRRNEWIESSGRAAAPRLLWLGDRLLAAGRYEDALRAYDRAQQCGAQTQARRWMAELLQTAAQQPDELTRTFHRLAEERVVGPAWALIGALALLTEQPDRLDEARELAECAASMPEGAGVAQVIRAVCAAPAEGRDALSPVEESLAGRPCADIVCAGLSLLDDTGVTMGALEGFMDAAGDRWRRLCPHDPEETMARALRRAAGDDIPAALDATGRHQDQWLELAPAPLICLHCLEALRRAEAGGLERVDEQMRHVRALLERAENGMCAE